MSQRPTPSPRRARWNFYEQDVSREPVMTAFVRLHEGSSDATLEAWERAGHASILPAACVDRATIVLRLLALLRQISVGLS